MKLAIALVLASALSAVGCKQASDGPAVPPAVPPATPAGTPAPTVPPPTEHGEHHGEHAGMPPELAAFHELLRPLWHAPEGDARMTNACAAVPQFQAQAEVVAKAAPPPGADAAKWAAATKELVDASAAMKDPCDKKDATAFAPAFQRVHEGFHGLLAAMGGGGPMHEHGEHGDHGDHDENHDEHH